jgi:hypothetical protein
MRGPGVDRLFFAESRLMPTNSHRHRSGWIDGMTAGFSLPAAGHVAQPSRERTAIARENCTFFDFAVRTACCTSSRRRPRVRK